MSTYIDGPVVHLNDVNGFHASIPVREVHRLAREANDSDDGWARYATRVIGRDVLNGAVDLLDQRPKCDGCHDAPATQDMGDGNKFCPACCSAAQGSRYDDPMEF